VTVMRVWRGAVRPAEAEAYLRHQADTGITEYRSTPGNVGAVVLSRQRGELVEVSTVSFWESLDSVKAFAGEDYEQAKFYPGDEQYLVEKDLTADHFDVVSAQLDPRLAL
jgi:heme-degrading monooxygenase HmoA